MHENFNNKHIFDPAQLPPTGLEISVNAPVVVTLPDTFNPEEIREYPLLKHNNEDGGVIAGSPVVSLELQNSITGGMDKFHIISMLPMPMSGGENSLNNLGLDNRLRKMPDGTIQAGDVAVLQETDEGVFKSTRLTEVANRIIISAGDDGLSSNTGNIDGMGCVSLSYSKNYKTIKVASLNEHAYAHIFSPNSKSGRFPVWSDKEMLKEVAKQIERKNPNLYDLLNDPQEKHNGVKNTVTSLSLRGKYIADILSRAKQGIGSDEAINIINKTSNEDYFSKLTKKDQNLEYEKYFELLPNEERVISTSSDKEVKTSDIKVYEGVNQDNASWTDVVAGVPVAYVHLKDTVGKSGWSKKGFVLVDMRSLPMIDIRRGVDGTPDTIVRGMPDGKNTVDGDFALVGEEFSDLGLRRRSVLVLKTPSKKGMDMSSNDYLFAGMEGREYDDGSLNPEDLKHGFRIEYSQDDGEVKIINTSNSSDDNSARKVAVVYADNDPFEEGLASYEKKSPIIWAQSVEEAFKKANKKIKK